MHKADEEAERRDLVDGMSNEEIVKEFHTVDAGKRDALVAQKAIRRADTTNVKEIRAYMKRPADATDFSPWWPPIQVPFNLLAPTLLYNYYAGRYMIYRDLNVAVPQDDSAMLAESMRLLANGSSPGELTSDEMVMYNVKNKHWVVLKKDV